MSSAVSTEGSGGRPTAPRSVKPIPASRADYAHHITIRPPSDFQTFPRPLDVPSNLRRGHFVSTAAAAHKKTRPLTMEPEFN